MENTYTLLVLRTGGHYSEFAAYQIAAWMPGFKSVIQAQEHIRTLKGSVYPETDYHCIIEEGERLGPLRRQFEHLLWWQPIEKQDLPREYVQA